MKYDFSDIFFNIVTYSVLLLYSFSFEIQYTKKRKIPLEILKDSPTIRMKYDLYDLVQCVRRTAEVWTWENQKEVVLAQAIDISIYHQTKDVAH